MSVSNTIIRHTVNKVVLNPRRTLVKLVVYIAVAIAFFF